MYYGGAQRVISMFLKPLIKDFNVHLVLFTYHINFEIPEEVNLHILFPEASEKNSALNKLTRVYSASRLYNNYVREHDIRMSLSFLALPNIVNGIVRAKNRKLRSVISERCFPSIMYKANKSSQLLSKYAIPRFYNKNDALFSNSININDDLRKNFKIKIPMSVIYNPIENIRIQKPNPSGNSQISRLRIINVGNIYEAKNQQLILEALNKLPKGNYFYTQAGTGVLEYRLKTLCKDYGLNKYVSFLGNTSQVKENLMKNDCFVLSSKTEGFPNVVLEALSCGLPVISTNCLTGPLELLNDNEPISIPIGGFAKAKYGLLVNVNDAAGLACALEFFWNNPEEMRKFGQLGYSRSKDYALPVIYEQLKTLLRG